ncbi:DUF732 domain-containing protein [Mycobacterium kubicae]|uniref:DUF732 domain-containing protein n=1 Tax=Mycobacterium kubicae TaxID=120959 RepID=UPI0007FFFB2A|nr:hypothetical protein A5657_03065 [Mycobacterium kubicae]
MRRYWGRHHSLWALGLLAAHATFSPIAAADTNDNAYLGALAAHNIASIAGPADLIDAGHQICGFLSPSTSPAMVTDYVYRASVNGGRFYAPFGNARNPITNNQAGILVNDAIAAYCPNSPGAIQWHAPFFPLS